MIADLVFGLVVGVILALTGAGGGILAVPMLVFGAGLTMAQAGPIGLLAVALAAALGAVMGLRAGVVRYKAATLIAGGGIVLAPFGIWLAQRLPNRPLALLFAGVLLVVAWRMFNKDRVALMQVVRPLPPCRLDERRGKLIWTLPCARVLAMTGMLTGLLSGLLGVGGGFVMVPALQRYTDLPMQAIVPTSLAVIAIVSIAGVGLSAASGGLDWTVALPFAAGALAGMGGGRLVAARLAGPQLNRAFALLAAAVACGMVAKALA